MNEEIQSYVFLELIKFAIIVFIILRIFDTLNLLFPYFHYPVISVLRQGPSVQNLPLLLFPKGLMNLFVKHRRDSKLCCGGAQTIILMMLHNYIFSTVF